MNSSNEKVFNAIGFLEEFINKANVNLIESGQNDLSTELISSWVLIVNQCEIASNARDLISILKNIQELDISL